MQGEIIDADGMVGPVCCRASEACRAATISSTSDNQPVECLGTLACYRSEINALSRVLCTGEYSCRDANINTEQEVYCAGRRACQGAEISAPVVYCSSWTGCTNANITFSVRRLLLPVILRGWKTLHCKGLVWLRLVLFSHRLGLVCACAGLSLFFYSFCFCLIRDRASFSFWDVLSSSIFFGGHCSAYSLLFTIHS